MSEFYRKDTQQVQPASHTQPSSLCTVTEKSAFQCFNAEEGREVGLLCPLLSKLLGQAQFPGPMGLEAACSP